MTGPIMRPVHAADRQAVHALVTGAFGQPDEADLVEALVAGGDMVLELVAEEDGALVGHVAFSRLDVIDANGRVHPAVALAPLAVAPHRQRAGIGMALVNEAHRRLASEGETLSIVVGHPGYYPRLGYSRAAASGFDSDYQCDAMFGLAFAPAPAAGRLRYAPAFSAL